jgi:hypothetical protein
MSVATDRIRNKVASPDLSAFLTRLGLVMTAPIMAAVGISGTVFIYILGRRVCFILLPR